MKKVVYSCITGGYDQIPIYNAIAPDWDYVLFTDNPELIKRGKLYHWRVRPLAFTKMDNVRNARWHKVNAHILFPEYDYSLWIDGNISIEKKQAFDIFEKFIKNHVLVVVPTHPSRKCIYQEAKTILNLSIDYPCVVKAEMKYLHCNKYPKNNGLSETCILLRRHNKICKALDLWWYMIAKYSKRDQLSFNYAMWKNNITIQPLYDSNDTETHRTSKNFKFTYGATHDQNKVKTRKFKLFEKKISSHGRKRIYFCGIKIFSYGNRKLSQSTNIPDSEIPQLLYRRFVEYTGKKPTDTLISLNEKIIWAQMFDATNLKTQLADKYTVREYIADKIGKHYLTKLYDVWDDGTQINFSKLPDKYVLKFSEGSGKVLLVPDKNKLDINYAKQQILNWKNNPFWLMSCEMQYKNSAKKIIAEEFINTKIEYKLWMFHGKCQFIKIEIMNEFAENGKPANQFGKYFYPDWSPADFRTIGAEPNCKIRRPAKLSELIRLSEILAAPFDFVRVDFFETNDGRLIFGEMTFSPAAGHVHFEPESKNIEFGKLWTLPPRDKYGFAIR